MNGKRNIQMREYNFIRNRKKKILGTAIKNLENERVSIK